MESTSAFHSTNLFLFSRHHIPTNGVAPLAAYKPFPPMAWLHLLHINPHTTLNSSNRSYSKCLLLNVTGKRLRSIAKQQCEIELQFCLNDKVLWKHKLVLRVRFTDLCFIISLFYIESKMRLQFIMRLNAMKTKLVDDKVFLSVQLNEKQQPMIDVKENSLDNFTFRRSLLVINIVDIFLKTNQMLISILLAFWQYGVKSNAFLI